MRPRYQALWLFPFLVKPSFLLMATPRPIIPISSATNSAGLISVKNLNMLTEKMWVLSFVCLEECIWEAQCEHFFFAVWSTLYLPWALEVAQKTIFHSENSKRRRKKKNLCAIACGQLWSVTSELSTNIRQPWIKWWENL